MTFPHNNPDTRFAWIDVENFGLDHKTDMPIEVGLRVTDLDLVTRASISVLIWSPAHQDRFSRLVLDETGGDKDAAFVLNMHTTSALWGEAMQFGIPLDKAEERLVEWLDRYQFTGQDPMAGSSVQFDRESMQVWMPRVFEKFHYRNVDISTNKEECRRYNPRLFRLLDEDVYAHAAKRHRVVPDLDDTIAEFKYYRDNFFFTDPSVGTF